MAIWCCRPARPPPATVAICGDVKRPVTTRSTPGARGRLSKGLYANVRSSFARDEEGAIRKVRRRLS